MFVQLAIKLLIYFVLLYAAVLASVQVLLPNDRRSLPFVARNNLRFNQWIYRPKPGDDGLGGKPSTDRSGGRGEATATEPKDGRLRVSQELASYVRDQRYGGLVCAEYTHLFHHTDRGAPLVVTFAGDATRLVRRMRWLAPDSAPVLVPRERIRTCDSPVVSLRKPSPATAATAASPRNRATAAVSGPDVVVAAPRLIDLARNVEFRVLVRREPTPGRSSGRDDGPSGRLGLFVRLRDKRTDLEIEFPLGGSLRPVLSPEAARTLSDDDDDAATAAPATDRTGGQRRRRAAEVLLAPVNRLPRVWQLERDMASLPPDARNLNATAAIGGGGVSSTSGGTASPPSSGTGRGPCWDDKLRRDTIGLKPVRSLDDYYRVYLRNLQFAAAAPTTAAVATTTSPPLAGGVSRDEALRRLSRMYFRCVRANGIDNTINRATSGSLGSQFSVDSATSDTFAGSSVVGHTTSSASDRLESLLFPVTAYLEVCKNDQYFSPSARKCVSR